MHDDHHRFDPPPEHAQPAPLTAALIWWEDPDPAPTRRTPMGVALDGEAKKAQERATSKR